MTIPQLVLPFRGEFGMKLRYHVPAVHALAPDVVCMEWGEEALYPTAKAKVVVARNYDEARRDTYAKDSQFLTGLRHRLNGVFPRHQFVQAYDDRAAGWFIPVPTERWGLRPDVVVCPRKREYGPGKNWGAWSDLTMRLQAEGLEVFAAGARDSSANVGCPAAWDHHRFLDATIEAMLAAKVVVATDAGLALLALLCGRPLIVVVTADGKAAPGPVITVGGREHHKTYWPIRLEQYYHPMNHQSAPIHVIRGGWEEPSLVVAAVARVVSGT